MVKEQATGLLWRAAGSGGPSALLISRTSRRWGFAGQDPVLDGEYGCGTARGDADLGVDVLNVVVGRFGRDHEPVGHLASCQTER
jgi:hypothetical protein